ncbi:MAG TPA: DUF6091 family protein [Myxococcota bacterium]|nr:DUF6091 family protein [Myxococcota bacterium]
MLRSWSQPTRAAFLAAVALLLSLAPRAAHAQQAVICVYDPMGASGAAYRLADSFRLKAKEQFGIDVGLRAYVEEKTAGDDLAAGKCAGAVVTGVRARSFGLASATIEAIGALPDYATLQTAITQLARPESAIVMTSGGWETAGIYPAGAVYLYVRDGTIRTAAQLAGKKISAISDDQAALTMIREVGAAGVGANTATFGPMFNNGSVDACYAPATALEPLELYKGISNGGGIIDFTLSQLTFQVVINKSWFPEGFGQWGRSFAASQFGAAKALVAAAEAKAQPHKLTIPNTDKPGYDQKFQAVRLRLRDQGVYNARILTLLRRVRCNADGSRAECATQVE